MQVPYRAVVLTAAVILGKQPEEMTPELIVEATAMDSKCFPVGWTMEQARYALKHLDEVIPRGKS
jgi:hypothetical protein